MEYSALSKNGELKMESEFMREKFKKFLKKYEGIRIAFQPVLPESKSQRKFFEGAVVPMACFFQEILDHRNYADLELMRERLKIEFNGEFVMLKGKGLERVGKSTSGQLKMFIDKVIDWLEDQYGIDRMEVLNPKLYKSWRDEIYPFGGPDNFIDYLVETKKLKKHI